MLRLTAVFFSTGLLVALGQQTASFEDAVRASMAGSIEKQRLSIQRQVGAVQPAAGSAQAASAGDNKSSGSSFFTIAWPTPPQAANAGIASVDCDPLPRPDLDRLVKAASEREGLSEKLVQAVIGKESAARPCAVSSKGAQGLMQLMPATAAQLGVVDPFDPKQNIEGGTHLLKQLLTRYNGDMALALGAYNAGSGRVDRDGGVPAIPETLNYVSDILNRFGMQ